MDNLTFYTTENVNQLWEYIEALLKMAAPGAMIWAAIAGVGLLIGIVVSAWHEASKKDDPDDDGYEIKKY